MSDPVITSLGRVQPIWKGQWASNVTYLYLDIISYSGSTYISLINNNRNNIPSQNPTAWQTLGGKGDKGDQGATGSFGTPIASATILETGSDPTVTVTADPSSPDIAKVFNFQFGIPAGPYGFDTVNATVNNLVAGSSATASASLSLDSDTRTLSFVFGIPAAQGTGALYVDNVPPDISRNVSLDAVRYATQSLSPSAQAIARENIGAMPSPTFIGNTDNCYVYYASGTWYAASSTIFIADNSTIDSICSVFSV